ncbi:protoporphyrinogen oxidase [Rufibacter latericius]|uniref:Coproporphyrinogen III oxidase n=1 Tax=Rufibacter latericius TaxID=2487040 RepID=A0A3M9MWS1_9BACT|nr:protoporphyrinogen oxidase [Rufibacter latericius]RNI29333.1 protoporphyrinogen oxidase [Rufibacter latericius]
MRVAIIGAGISGLALAYYLQKLGVRYDLFESEPQVGGVIKSVQQGAYQLELGPHSLQLNEELQELLQELKLEDEVIRPATKTQDRYIRKDGEYYCLPSSPRRLLLDSFFHWRTKLKITQEYKLPPQEVPEETISNFFKRRFGQEVVDYLVQPMVAGIYGGDPDKLLLEKTFPALKEMERTHGSVLKGLDLLQNDKPSKTLISLLKGLQSLPEAIASKLVSLHVDHKVEMIHRAKGKYLLSIQHDVEGLADEEFDAVVIALPAHAAAELLDYTTPGLAAALHNVSYAPLTVVHTAYRKHAIGFPLDGFGAMHPRKEQPFSCGTVWSSALFPRICPDDEVLFSSFVGGSQSSEFSHLPAAEILLRVHEELTQNYDISANLPVFQHLHRWPAALPQADMFITDVHQLAQMMEEDHLYSCTNWVAGPSIPDCVRYAKHLAQKIFSQRPSLQ